MVTVLSKPDCQQCRATARKLDSLGIEYEYIDMTQDESALLRAKELGYLAAPVVIAGDRHWSGFQPDALSQLAQSPAC